MSKFKESLNYKFKIERTKFGGYQAVLYYKDQPLFTSAVYAARISAEGAIDTLRNYAQTTKVVETI